jgi:uncharacterized protein with von Willebrand factor type A (vWA) domain
MRGEEPDFDSFMEQYGDMFGDNPPQSLDELIAQMQAQMQAMQSLMAVAPRRPAPAAPEPARRQASATPSSSPSSPSSRRTSTSSTRTREDPTSYPFRGDEEIDLQAAMQLMNEMHNIDDLERDLERAQYTGELDHVDLDQLRELLGDDAVDHVRGAQASSSRCWSRPATSAARATSGS